MSSTGAFTYTSPDFAYVPMWLPAFYLHLSFVTRVIDLAFLSPRPAARE